MDLTDIENYAIQARVAAVLGASEALKREIELANSF
jgi:hypothetical protein